jgi:hypothetical protein
MASTYSDLKIELIGTGEQVGTWGATTNTNLGTAIEEAIVGSASVSFSSADVTLTLTNTNGTQAARHLRLNLTGTSGGARNLILGSGCQIDKPYIINNGLADTVTVKNTTGTGVAVPAGKTMWVYNNGTNVVEAMNHAASLTLGAALPVASGGTGITSFGTGVATALGQNVTGSGGMVLATSATLTTPTLTTPTLTTPVLGTPSSGTLTNCTGLPIVNGTTGTLSVARGGTGATTLTANNVLLGNGTSSPQFVAPGTSGNVLTSNGTTWTSATPVVFVTGMIMLWSGSVASIPSGWALCNGSNGTPDLRNRFVVGAGSTYAVDATGGSADAIVVSHTHTATSTSTSTVTDPGHFHTFSGTTTGPGGDPLIGNVVGTSSNTNSATTGITVATTTSTTNASTGSSGTNANLPPYYALAYIMKT